ncbi:hypothetical protein GBAR_LOCUS10421, partial [Geodia barretti]
VSAICDIADPRRRTRQKLAVNSYSSETEAEFSCNRGQDLRWCSMVTWRSLSSPLWMLAYTRLSWLYTVWCFRHLVPLTCRNLPATTAKT